MKNKRLMNMNLQYFAQTWNPDHVLVHEMKDGTIPDEYNTLILKETMENSKVMQLARFEEMQGREKKFEFFAEGPGAYWVGEGEKIKTSTAKWLQVTMETRKLGVILPVSREYLNYKMSDFFAQMHPRIAEAFYKKFDEAVLLDINNPFNQSMQESVSEAGNIVTGPLDFDTILDLEDTLEEHEIEANAYISNRKNRRELREASKEIGGNTELAYDRNHNTINGLPVVDFASLPKGELFAGDFDCMRYGIPYNINFKISEEAQLSTIKNEDGSPVNLFEQELFALRATMDVAFMIIKDEAFAKIEPGETPEEQEKRSGKELNKSEIKAILDERGIEYTDKETKDELLAKLGE
ncbi:phage major capsid protein [Enterococcus sp. AZ147]|uniref:phage major capsid protein n=1 Tax=Enterococcus sp. AZ147 TaxID=2774769 RepID=UPI003F27C44F